jgi:hypothetical protein
MGSSMKHIQSMMVMGLGALLLSGCGSKAERTFTAGCKQMSDSSVCSCIYDTLEDHYGSEKVDREIMSYSPSKEF